MKTLTAIALTVVAIPALSLDDYGLSGLDVKPGQNIKTYNYNTRQHRDVDIDSVRSYGGTKTIEAYDYNTNTYQTIEITTPVTLPPSRYELRQKD
jgi:hypothetical protein